MNVPVIFRAVKAGEFKGELIAFLPTLEAGPNCYMSYQHIGQHGEASRDFYRTTRPATPQEYLSLLTELRGIYSDCKLIVKKRIGL